METHRRIVPAKTHFSQGLAAQSKPPNRNPKAGRKTVCEEEEDEEGQVSRLGNLGITTGHMNLMSHVIVAPSKDPEFRR